MKQIFTLQRNCKRCGGVFVIHNPRSYYCPDCHQGVCVICGKSFIRWINFKSETCSQSCASKYASRKFRSRTALTCQWCGKEFFPSNGHLGMKYCGRKCRYESERKPDPETKHTGWKYRAWRKAVMGRDQHTCRDCGAKEKIGAHHIKAWKDYPELRYEVLNGITLCESCHLNAHGASVPRIQKHFEPTCEQCGKQTKGKAKLCKSCAMKSSLKAQAWRAQRARDKKGRFA
jgi:HNH endonuclease